MRNLHRITGAVFQHIKPNLCPTCQHYEQYPGWEGYCSARDKILSNAIVEKGSCKDYSERISDDQDETSNEAPAR